MNDTPENYLRVELHLHTDASADSLVTPQQLIAHCARRGIDRVAVTDHNSIDGALAAQALAPDRVIVGEEVQTTQGELLGYFLTEWVPPGLEPLDAIKRLRAQGAVISVSHPFDHIRGPHWTHVQLLAILPHIDAIETFNARCYSNKPNQQAAEFAIEHGLLATVGSDAHSLMEVGRATLSMPSFDDPASFLAALGKAHPHTRRSSILVHLISTYGKLVTKLRRN
jgi:hypothetical protein